QIIEDFFSAQEPKATWDVHALSDDMWAAVERRIHKKDRVSHKHVVERKRANTAWLRTAIAMALIVTLVYSYYQGAFGTEDVTREWIMLDVPKGQKSIVTLTDGTRIFLNGGSSVSYPEVFQSDTREVKLS